MNQTNDSPRPDTTGTARSLSQTLLTDGPLSDATAALEKMLIDTPDDIDLLLDLGYASMKKKDWVRAATAFERAASLRPQDSGIQYAQVELYEAQGELVRAAELLSLLVQCTPDVRLLHKLSLLLLQVARWDEAERVFSQLRRLDSEHELTMLYGCIWCQIQKQNWYRAFDLVLQATRLDRYNLTTALLSYVKDRLFDRVKNDQQRKDELGKRIMAELRTSAELQISAEIIESIDSDKEIKNG
jgi:tetratricopeptide (TPR) repeat protein